MTVLSLRLVSDCFTELKSMAHSGKVPVVDSNAIYPRVRRCIDSLTMVPDIVNVTVTQASGYHLTLTKIMMEKICGFSS